MMKRTSVINAIITMVLGLATGSFIHLATSTSSIHFGVLAIVAATGCVLNILCGSDKQKKDEDKKE